MTMSPESPPVPARLDRRQALAWLGAAAVGLGMIGRIPVGAAEPTDRPHGKRIGSDPVLNKTYAPGELWPLSFTPAQRLTKDSTKSPTTLMPVKKTNATSMKASPCVCSRV